MTTDLFGTSPAIPSGTATSKHHGRRVLALGFVATTAMALFIGGVGATASAGPTVATINVGSSLTLTAQVPAFTLTGLAGATVSQNGVVTLNVETNNLAGYSVTIQAAAPTLAATAVTNLDSIPIGALSFRQTGDTTWVPTTVAAQTVTTKGTRSAEGGDLLSDDYQIVIPFVNQDLYTATLNYVAAVL